MCIRDRLNVREIEVQQIEIREIEIREINITNIEIGEIFRILLCNRWQVIDLSIELVPVADPEIDYGGGQYIFF